MSASDAGVQINVEGGHVGRLFQDLHAGFGYIGELRILLYVVVALALIGGLIYLFYYMSTSKEKKKRKDACGSTPPLIHASPCQRRRHGHYRVPDENSTSPWCDTPTTQTQSTPVRQIRFPSSLPQKQENRSPDFRRMPAHVSSDTAAEGFTSVSRHSTFPLGSQEAQI